MAGAFTAFPFAGAAVFFTTLAAERDVILLAVILFLPTVGRRIAPAADFFLLEPADLFGFFDDAMNLTWPPAAALRPSLIATVLTQRPELGYQKPGPGASRFSYISA
ncbi:MAG: hypothetical protein KIT79_05115 [Deltaproteobacteria bacterium]|nr:hypothetical protein [Deltaproteobacteria bacterium]